MNYDTACRIVKKYLYEQGLSESWIVSQPEQTISYIEYREASIFLDHYNGRVIHFTNIELDNAKYNLDFYNNEFHNGRIRNIIVYKRNRQLLLDTINYLQKLLNEGEIICPVGIDRIDPWFFK